MRLAVSGEPAHPLAAKMGERREGQLHVSEQRSRTHRTASSKLEFARGSPCSMHRPVHALSVLQPLMQSIIATQFGSSSQRATGVQHFLYWQVPQSSVAVRSSHVIGF